MFNSYRRDSPQPMFVCEDVTTVTHAADQQQFTIFSCKKDYGM